MPDLLERLDEHAHVKGSLVNSHLVWAAEKVPDLRPTLLRQLGPQHHEIVEKSILASAWIPFASVVALDRAIAAVVGGDPARVFDSLGRASARQNLAGVYRSFQDRDPHRFFLNSATLHDRYQDFGEAYYDALEEREGRFSIRKCTAFSPVHCIGERGYLAEALTLLGASDDPVVVEVSCRCAGDDGCTFHVGW